MPHNDLPHVEMIGQTTAMADALTPELYAYLLSLLPNPQSFRELVLNYRTSFTESLDGDPELAKACEIKRMAVNDAVAILLALGKAVHRKDPKILDKLAVNQVLKPASAGTADWDPKEWKIYFDKKGKMFASLAKITKVKGYEVWFCNGDPSIESNWNFLLWSSNCKKITITGLDRTKANFLRVRGKRGETVGPWSHFIRVDPV